MEVGNIQFEAGDTFVVIATPTNASNVNAFFRNGGLSSVVDLLY